MAGTGVTFDDVHSYRDWGLKLKQITIGLPETKTEYVDVPGMNGSLDLTEAQNGGVKYGMRSLSFVFDARHCNYTRWTGLISAISAAIHGKKKKIVLDIDSGYYYTGRCSVDTQKTNEATAEIMVNCNCDPFKMAVNATNEPWKWDPFRFLDGIIQNTGDIAVNNTSGWQKVTLIGMAYSEDLRIVTSAAMQMKCNETTYSLETGENIMYDLDLTEGTNELYFQGKGTVTLIYRGGML